jgi:hypothetical protein
MRLWSIHPEYLDTKGLVALWREGLLAQRVLMGKTKGYSNHPQLERFKKTRDAVSTIGTYLRGVYTEAQERGFNFNRGKVIRYSEDERISVTQGQLEYEFQWLLVKLKVRDKSRYERLQCVISIKAHPIFVVCPGGVEPWERERKE